MGGRASPSKHIVLIISPYQANMSNVLNKYWGAGLGDSNSLDSNSAGIIGRSGRVKKITMIRPTNQTSGDLDFQVSLVVSGVDSTEITANVLADGAITPIIITGDVPFTATDTLNIHILRNSGTTGNINVSVTMELELD